MKAYTTTVICVALILSSLANADQVYYLDHRSSAKEIEHILFGTRGRTRTAVLKPNWVGVGLEIEFDLNSSAIKPEYESILYELGSSIQLHSDTKLRIEGHTDALGSDQYNFVLSKRRANAVRDYLVRNFKISPHQLEVKGFGKTKLRNNMSPYDGRNRRVEFFSEYSN